MSALNTQDLTLAYERATIVSDLNLALPTGQITVLVGPNGCGKSTLLRGMARLLPPRAGRVLLDGHDVHRMSTGVLAQRLGILPQSPVAPEGLTVYELVAQGRYPHQRWYQQWSAADEAAVQRALCDTHLCEMADSPVDTLSGGQRQRAWVAMTLAQDSEVILLDEPTTYLDLAHQLDVLDLLQTLNIERGKTIVMVLHDLNHACRYADYLVALRGGQVVAHGHPADVVTEGLVRDVFGLESMVVDDPVTGTPLVVPVGRRDRAARRQRQPLNVERFLLAEPA